MDTQDLIYLENLVNRALDDIGFGEASYKSVEDGLASVIVHINMPYEDRSLDFSVTLRKDLLNFSSIRAILSNQFPTKRR